MMRTPTVIFSILLTVFVSCRATEKVADSSDLNMFNGEILSPKSPGFGRAAKIYYQRGGQEFTSTAFFLSPRLLITSGHSIAGDTSNFGIAVDGGPTRWVLPVIKKLVSLGQFVRFTGRGTESLDVGVLGLADGSISRSFEVMPPAAWPPSVPGSVEIIGTGKNEHDNGWNQVVKKRGVFPLFEVTPLILSYDMSQVGSPFTAVGDSGSPIFKNGRIVGVHSGNYATNGVVSSGFGNSLFYPPLADIIRDMGDEFLDDEIKLFFARARYLNCAANQPQLQNLLPLYIDVASSDLAHAVVIDVKDWSVNSAFYISGMPTQIVSDRAPWLVADRTSMLLRLKMVEIKPAQCIVGSAVELKLLRPNRFDELALQFRSQADAVFVTLRPNAKDNHTMKLSK